MLSWKSSQELFTKFKSVELKLLVLHLWVAGFWGGVTQSKPNKKLCILEHFDMKLSLLLHIILAHKSESSSSLCLHPLYTLCCLPDSELVRIKSPKVRQFWKLQRCALIIGKVKETGCIGPCTSTDETEKGTFFLCWGLMSTATFAILEDDVSAPLSISLLFNCLAK